MSAVLKYGDFSHAANENIVNITRRALENETGFVYGYVESFAITGILQGDTLADLKTAWEEIEDAYALQNKDLSWEFDNVPIHEMKNSETLYGVKVAVPPHYPDGGGPGELVNRRSYSLVVEGAFLFAASKTDPSEEPYITKYSSSFSTTGTGGAPFVHIPLLKGRFQKQYPTETSLVTGTQSGSAAGLGRYPTPDPPLAHLVDFEKVDRRQIRQGEPRKINNVDIEFPIFWVYTFERNQGFPTASS